MESGPDQKSGNTDGLQSCDPKIDSSSSSSSTSGFSSRSSCDTSSDEAKAEFSSSPVPLGWPIRNAQLSKRGSVSNASGDERKKVDTPNSKKLESNASEMNMLKERFAKLLLGEDMSGSGKGVCTALAISNAITNLCATVFGQLWRLEPLPSKKKTMWRREMEWFLSISDHIVELIPSWQTFPDGRKLEVMASMPRSDLSVNLPALRKLDNMLMEILDSFESTEFWYVDQGSASQESDQSDASASFRQSLQRQEEKWWLPVPRVPAGGLGEKTRKQLNHKRECANQILKASMAINTIALSEMEVPDSYLETLPKNGRACLGDVIYRYITSEQFSAECLFDCLDISSEHYALEIANRVEASIYMWCRRVQSNNPNRSTSKSSWEMVKDLMVDGDKREVLARRAESLLLSLKKRFPGLTQTTLETSKIQCNKDVGKAILESYSRVLESLAYKIVSQIDDLLYVDDLTRQSSGIAQKKVPISGTPYKSAFGTPKFSPAPSLVSPARGERTPFLGGNNNKQPRRGNGVKRVLTNYLGAGNEPNKNAGLLTGRLNLESQKDCLALHNGCRSRQIDR